MYKTLVEAVLAHGADSELSGKMAIGWRKERYSYAELCGLIKKTAAKLSKDFGISKGDNVMMTAVPGVEYIVILLAVQYLGATTVPLDKNAKEQNLLTLYQFINPKLILTDIKVESFPVVSQKGFYKEMLAEEENLFVEYVCPEMDGVAEMLFTTGTTGVPKGVMLSYGNIYASIHNTWNGTGMLGTDTVLIPLPLNHSLGMRVFRTALYCGASVVIQNGFAFAKELENNINTFGCTAMVSVPASMDLIMRQMQEHFPEIIGKLRYMEVGAGSLSYDLKKKLAAMLPNTRIVNTWGSTETGGAIFLNVSERLDKYTSLGKPIEGVEIKMVDEAGNKIEARSVETAGRMALKGTMCMKGYYNLPEENKKALVDGWLYTNDIVYQDEEGFVYMLGRADAIINVGGEKVSPIEVENIAQEFEQIRECGCIGVEDPDGILGYIPVLYVVPEGTFDKNALVKYLTTKLESYKIPQKFVEIDALPRNRMQKLDYKELKCLWAENGAESLVNPVLNNIFNRHSVRDFTDQSIAKSKLERIVQAGIYAPTGHNLQTWKFTVIQDAEKISELRSVIEKTAKEQELKLYGFNNPVALILISNDRRNENCIQDSACAAENIMLAATSYGIGTVWLNHLKKISDCPEIRELLNSYGIPESHIVWATIGMGYPAGEVKSPLRKLDVVEWV